MSEKEFDSSDDETPAPDKSGSLVPNPPVPGPAL